MADKTSNFVQTAEVLADGDVKLSKYKSTASGINVCIAQAYGPLVSGFTCIATEAHDDDGLPHTLEHLIFMGSEEHPYKGIMDQLAVRCLSSGTNAWTDTDHTCFTMCTAGPDGFLKLLPLYIDHLLYPILTQDGYLTEVHHINGDGEDAGVVYCEMQGRENAGESRCHLALLRAMYPGYCGYKQETGGLLKNLRESTSNEKVIAYHSEFYRPENMCIIIVGQIEPEKVFEALSPIEEKILKKKKEGKPFIRPWQTPIPSLVESTVVNVDYPCDEEEFGFVLAAWRGPFAKDYAKLISINILLEYFTDTSVAPLNRELVEIDDPLCNDVDYTVIENSESCIYLHFSSVPSKRFHEIKEKLLEVFRKVADGSDPLDMTRMKTVIRKRKLYILSSMESNPHDQLASCLIGDFLYGSSVTDLEARVNEVPLIDDLFMKDREFWIDLLKSYIVDAKYVIVTGNPSISLSEEFLAEEKERIRKQQEKLGSEGLEMKSKILKKAMEFNSLPPPKELIASVSIPSMSCIKYHPIRRACNFEASSKSDEKIDFDIEKMPCRFQLDDVITNFVRVYVLMDTSDLPQELRLYLPLFVELLDESAVKRDGEIIPYQDVVKQLAEDTISIYASVGLNYSRFFCSHLYQVISLKLMVEEEKYEEAVQWIHTILYNIVFEPSRIQSTLKKMTSDVSTMKRDGGSINGTIITNTCYSPECNRHAASMLRQFAFLTKCQEKLDSAPDEVIRSLYELRDKIALPDKMTVHLAINVKNLKQKTDLERPWIDSFLPSTQSPKISPTFPVRRDDKLVLPFLPTTNKGYISGVSCIESSYLMQTAPCITSVLHEDYPALSVLLQYLTQGEGPLWKLIRGPGLAYGYSISYSPYNGMIYFSLYKSSHPVKAYTDTKKMIDSCINGTMPWDQSLLDASHCALVFDLADEVKTVDNIIHFSLTSYYKGIGMDFTKLLFEKISKVTFSDMEKIAVKYLAPLFDTSVSRCAVCCHPSKVNDIVNDFKELSRDLTVLPSLEDSFMAEY